MCGLKKRLKPRLYVAISAIVWLRGTTVDSRSCRIRLAVARIGSASAVPQRSPRSLGTTATGALPHGRRCSTPATRVRAPALRSAAHAPPKPGLQLLRPISSRKTAALCLQFCFSMSHGLQLSKTCSVAVASSSTCNPSVNPSVTH